MLKLNATDLVKIAKEAAADTEARYPRELFPQSLRNEDLPHSFIAHLKQHLEMNDKDAAEKFASVIDAYTPIDVFSS